MQTQKKTGEESGCQLIFLWTSHFTGLESCLTKEVCKYVVWLYKILWQIPINRSCARLINSPEEKYFQLLTSAKETTRVLQGRLRSSGLFFLNNSKALAQSYLCDTHYKTKKKRNVWKRSSEKSRDFEKKIAGNWKETEAGKGGKESTRCGGLTPTPSPGNVAQLREPRELRGLAISRLQEPAGEWASPRPSLPKPPHFTVWIRLFTLSICVALIVCQALRWVRGHTQEQAEQVPGLLELTSWWEETVYNQVEK